MNLDNIKIGLGCMGLSHAYGSATSEDEFIEFIQKSYKKGYRFFDTAEAYTGLTKDGVSSNNEEILGKAIEPFRNKVIIATKFGVTHKGESLDLDSSPQTIRKSVEGSLERLNVNSIDLYYQHRIDPRFEPEEIANEMHKLIDEGLIKSWGISEANEDYLRRAHEICPVTAIQNRYSMLARWHENQFPACEEMDIKFVAFSPMANGFLTGLYNSNSTFENGDYRNSMPQYSEDGFESARKLTDLLNALAQDNHATAAQISLAWMMCKKDYIIPIPGTTSIENMQSNYDSINVKLSKATIDEIDDLLDSVDIPVFGGHG